MELVIDGAALLKDISFIRYGNGTLVIHYTFNSN